MPLVGAHQDNVDIIHASHVDQYKDLLTGVMTDQPVTIHNSVTATSFTAVGPNSPYAASAGILPGEEVTALNPTNAKAYGVMADGQFISDGVMNGTTAVLTSASGLFKVTDVGKICLVPGAGTAGALLSTTIASYQSPTQVTLAAVSQTAVSSLVNGQVSWGTNDAAAWVAVQAGVLSGARVIVPWGYSLYTGTLMGGITKSLSLEGLGASELWGTVAQSASTSVPGLPPYVAGSVLVPCSPATDAIQILGTGITVPRRNLAIKFPDGIAFQNTGHGVYAVPTALVSGGHENGETGSRDDNLIVFGHDGNHYAYYAVNNNLTTSDHMRSYGGGVLYLECDSFVSSYGNSVYVAPYGALFAGGTANGYTLKSRTSTFPGSLNLLEFVRPQCNIQGALRGSTAPSVAQYLWQTLGANPVGIAIDNPDLEGTLYNNPVNFGTISASVIVQNGGTILTTSPVVYPRQTHPEQNTFQDTVFASNTFVLGPAGTPGGGTAGDLVVSRGGGSPGTAVIYFGSAAVTNYLYFSGTYFQFVGANQLLNLRVVKQGPSEAQLVSGVDATAGNYITVTLTAARVVGAPTNPATGQRLTFTLVQNGTGGWGITWNAIFKGVTWADTGNTLNKRSTISFIYDGFNWNQEGAQAPYAA